MQDEKILDLYFARSERAIEETENKYGKYCFYISNGILHSHEAAEECVNDTYLAAWKSIPPARPAHFRLYLARLARNISVNRLIHDKREKRYSEGQLPLDELSEVVSTDEASEEESFVLREALNDFLSGLPQRTRIIFVRRYWYGMDISEIAEKGSLSTSNVKVILMRTRNLLSEYLKNKGFDL